MALSLSPLLDGSGAELRWGTVTHVDFSERPFRLVVDETTPLVAEAVIFEWLRSASHPRFREALRLVK